MGAVGAGGEEQLGHGRHELDPTKATVLGTDLDVPFLVGPVAFQLLAHPDGEAGMARAARDAGTVMCLSSLTSTRAAEVAQAAPEGKRWMQVYCFRDPGVTRAMVEEAAEAGYEALLLTVDAPYAGKRERDIRTGFEVPADIRAPAIEAAAGHRSLTPAEVFALVDPSVTWKDLEQQRQRLIRPDERPSGPTRHPANGHR